MRLMTILIGSILSLAFLGEVAAAPLSIPEWREGQHVYVVPEGWRPPLFGPRDLQELERAAAALRFPFYVIIAQRLEGGGDGDRLAAEAIDTIAQRWTERAADFDVSQSQLFLLSFEPRKYRFLTGTRWKAELGFERSAHRPHTALFERSVKGTPKDPKGGILALMRSVDAYLVDQTDPARIAARQEAERRAVEARRLRDARGALDSRILTLAGLLDGPADYLPADTAPYRDLLAKAKRIRQADDPGEMLAFADSMRSSIDTLSTYVGERRGEARARWWAGFVKLLVGGLLLFGLIFFLVRRWRKYASLKASFVRSCAEWKERVGNASVKYVEFHNELSEMRSYLTLEGETKELADRVAQEVDRIFMAVKAMESHVGRCQLLAVKAGFFRIDPLKRATERLEGEFSFDTEQLNPEELFGGSTKVITVVPQRFVEELKERFRKSMADWKTLKEATRLWRVPAKKLFPQDRLDEMIIQATEHGIPLRWLQDHPLFGDDAADQEVYDRLDRKNDSDPVAFFRGLEELRDKERQVGERLDRLVEAVGLAADRRLSAPADPGIALEPDDDPAVTYDKALREDHVFAGLLASRDDPEEVMSQARAVRAFYVKCAEQTATILKAKETVETVMAQALSAQNAAESARAAATERVAVARKVHSVVDVEHCFREGDDRRRSGDDLLAAVVRHHEENRLVSAVRAAHGSIDRFREAAERYGAAVTECERLDAKRDEFRQVAAQMSSLREQAARKIRSYDGSPSRLQDSIVPQVDGPADYAALLAELIAIQESWRQEERRARRAYEAEQERLRRIREAEERRRREAERRRREEEERRRRQSSSSGGGWGGGSSSSGGGWGGGGSSSSGGDW